MTVLAIGSSHLTAIWRGYRQYCRQNPIPFDLERLQIENEFYRPFATEHDKRVVYNERLVQDMTTHISSDGIRQIVCCIGGNVHNVLGLVNDPHPFDLLLPGAVADDAAPGVDVLPYDLVVATLRHRNRAFIDVLRLVKALAGDLPVCQLCPPPPIARGDHILNHPAGFGDLLECHGVAPARLRWKLWRTYCNMLAGTCGELGVRCLEVPPACLDSAGFLDEACCGADPTHANETYGMLVVAQLAALFAMEPA